MSNEINVKLLRKVKRHILEEPRRFDMGEFIREGERAASFAAIHHREVPPCGTVACIAGWAVLLSGNKSDNLETVEETADALLGLSYLQGDRLFYTSEWPFELRHDYREAELKGDLKTAAEVAARRIEHFIKTKGAE